MATRINENYWGAPNTYIYNNGGTGTNKRVAKVATILYPDVIYNHNELLNKQHDTSVTVWGMPADCSVARFSTVSWWSDDGAFTYEILAPDVLTYIPMSFIIEGYTGDNIIETWGGEDYVSFNIYSNRTAYGVSLYNTSGAWTNPDAGTIYYSHGMRTTPSQGSDNNYLMSEQVVSYDYRQNMLLPQLCIMPRRGVSKSVSLLSGRYDTIDNAIASYNTTYGTNNNDFVLVGISFKMISGLRFSAADSQRYYTAQNTPIPVQCGAAGTPSTRTRALYYANDAEYGYIIPQKLDRCIGFGANDIISNIPTAQASTLPTANTYFDNSTTVYSFSTNKARTCDNIFKLSTKKQVFDDIEYHWSFGLSYGDDNELHDFDDVDLTGMTAGVINSISLVPYVVIDDDKGADNITAIKRVVLHELAFYGLPLVTSQNAGFTAFWNDEEENILIPLFTDNMITTGEYTTLKQAFADSLPQTSWTDVFTNSYIINHYDPDYQPSPEPEPTGGDTGNLENSTLSNQYFKGSNHYYLVNETTLKNFIATINGLYVGDPDDTQMKLDFKGSNPNDYIVGIYGIPIDLLAATVGDTIHLGCVDTGISAAVLSPAWQHTINFGTYDIPRYFNDFRDFEPYTSIELYIPLCGTVKLNAAEYVGHTVKVDGIFDLQTGELTCRVIRKSNLGDTVTHTLNGSIWVEIPVSARDMGDFQNNQHQLKMALIQTGFNQISRTFGRAATDISSAASAAKTGGKSGLNLNGLNAVTVAGDAIQTGIDTANITYQIEHTPPAVSITSTASTSNGVMMYNKAKIFIKRCVMLDTYNAETYAHTVGHATVKNTTIGAETTEDKNSLIVCSNADLSGISATAAEISAIQSLLTGGIYV